MTQLRRTGLWRIVLVSTLFSACRTELSEPGAPAPQPSAPAPAVVEDHPRPPLFEPPKLLQPVPLWENGKVSRTVDGARAAEEGYVLLDLGEGWTPYLFTDGFSNDGKPLMNAYRPTYIALARGEFPDDFQGERAAEDKYLELYGIPPTLHLVRERMQKTSKLACTAEVDLAPFIAFKGGLVTYDSNAAAKKRADDFVYLRSRVNSVMHEQHVETPEAIDTVSLSNRDKDALARYLKQQPERAAVEALQQRLECEGYMKGRGKYITGALDWATHEALAEFEKRNRVFSWGYLGKDSLVPLSMPPMQTEREALMRVLVERAMHAMGVIEDGSASTLPSGEQRTWKGLDGKSHTIPNLLGELRNILVESFGLQTPESSMAWLEALGELPAGEHRFVAIKAPTLPEYYNGDMQLTLDYDRGDVWYDFPYGEQGQELPQSVQRRPQVTVSVLYNEQKIPIARFGTTIGGWRTESVEGVSMWKYKDSPIGPRAWEQIVASPVWLPPDSTPADDLLKKNRKKKKLDDSDYVVNYHETGPSYASAYGLVAAYHREYYQRADGKVVIGRDEGIRTHGSVDYMSIMRRHSHGCHRMHNHIALRLMSFVLAHRPHHRVGQDTLNYKKAILHDEEGTQVEYIIDIPKGGYVFVLDTPVLVNVEEGRVRGDVKAPIEFPIPKYNEEIGAYVMPDGTGVRVDGSELVPVPLPLLPDGGTRVIEPTGESAAAPEVGATHVDVVPTVPAVAPKPPTAVTAPVLPPPVPGR